MAHGQSPKHQRKSPPRKRRGVTRSKSEVAPAGPERLQKLLAMAGLASRRGAEDLIRAHRVSVNGKPASIGDSADPSSDVVQLDGQRIAFKPASYWLLHKPTGVVTTLADTHGRKTVLDLMPPSAGRLHPVGRLDRESSGLLLMTNDGAFTQALLHPSNGSEKEYRVTVKGKLEEKTLRKLTRGVHLEDGKTAPAKLSAIHYEPDRGLTTLRMVLTEGRNRQIRRSMLVLGHPVKKLMRVRIGPLVLGRLDSGAARPLRPDEISRLRSYVANLKPGPRPRGVGRKKPAAGQA